MQACFSDFLSPSLHVNHLTCKAASNIPAHRHNSLKSRSPGGKLASRTIVYGLSHENEDTEKHCSNHFTDDTVFICSEDDKNSEKVNKELAPSVVQSDTDLVQSDTDLVPFVIEHGDSENLLDKLNAVQLHMLAMEQWNASRVKACYKYVIMFLFIEVNVMKLCTLTKNSCSPCLAFII